MDRCKNLAKAVNGISCTIDAFRQAEVLTQEEYEIIRSAIWKIVIEAEKREAEILMSLEKAELI